MLTSRRAFALVLGTTVLLAGCRKAKPATEPTPTVPVSQPAPATSGTTAPTPTPAPPATNDGAAALTAAKATLEGAVFFEYDQDALSTDAQALLDQKLAVLVANPGVAVRVTGHADERGSDEYNLALGQRRAATVKRYLTDRGVAETRIEIVSMGEERPDCMGADDNCYRQNRRAEFDITTGSISAPPRR